MSLKTKALLQTLGMFGAAIAGSVLTTWLIKNISADVLFNIVGAGIIFALGYAFYQVTLSRLESEERLKDLDNKSKNANYY